MDSKTPEKSTATAPSTGGSSRKKHPVLEYETLPARLKLLLKKLIAYYENGEFERTVLPIINNRDPLPACDLDWLVTNYSKEFPVIYPNPENASQPPINVHESYEHYEKNWKKELFDPFQRGPRIYYRDSDGNQHETTIGQLNFFMWAIKFGVLDWAIRHKHEIQQHHAKVMKARKALIQSQPNRKKKRMRLTPKDNSGCMVYVQPMRVSMATGGTGSENPQ